MEAVRGTKGYWHATDGESWVGNSRLSTLCQTPEGIGPNNREVDTRKVDCPKCLNLLEIMQTIEKS